MRRERLKIFLVLLHCAAICSSPGTAQDSLFVQRSGTNLVLSNRPFYAVGVNSYFLQNLAAQSDTVHLLEILQTARQIGLTTIRTWGFFDSEDSTNPAVIQFDPGRHNESGLRALDYVVAKAKTLSLRLIIPFVNNWDDYGGMNQYLRWLAGPSKDDNPTAARAVHGTGGRKYAVDITQSLTHDDFYTHPTVRQWFKDYVSMLLSRINVFTGVAYRDEPVILLWELANEPRSSDRTGAIVAAWLDEMSRHVKSIDTNHLVSSGEEGHDVSPAAYSPLASYADQAWLFDGSAGSSFVLNAALPNIDVVGIHCYPADWRIPPSAAAVWMRDHRRIAEKANKPVILGEVGTRRDFSAFFDAVLSTALHEDLAGVLPWQFVYEGRSNSDGYAFECMAHAAVCSVLQRYAAVFDRKRSGMLLTPSSASLYQNYPNPFNYTTLISFDVTARENVRLSVYNVLGQEIAVLMEGLQEPGRYAVLFDAPHRPSGAYFARLDIGNRSISRKLLLLK